MLSILDILEDTTVDGPGFRTAIYAAGCPNGCPGCHNPESWDINRGRWMSTDEILQKVLARIYESYYENPREILLMFYYPSEEYISCLMTEEALMKMAGIMLTV